MYWLKIRTKYSIVVVQSVCKWQLMTILFNRVTIRKEPPRLIKKQISSLLHLAPHNTSILCICDYAEMTNYEGLMDLLAEVNHLKISITQEPLKSSLRAALCISADNTPYTPTTETPSSIIAFNISLCRVRDLMVL